MAGFKAPNDNVHSEKSIDFGEAAQLKAIGCHNQKWIQAFLTDGKADSTWCLSFENTFKPFKIHVSRNVRDNISGYYEYKSPNSTVSSRKRLVFHSQSARDLPVPTRSCEYAKDDIEIKVENKSNRHLVVMHVNQYGAKAGYGKIAPGEEINLSTHVDQVWEIYDENGKLWDAFRGIPRPRQQLVTLFDEPRNVKRIKGSFRDSGSY